MTSHVDIQWLAERTRAQAGPASGGLTVRVARGNGTSIAYHEGTTIVVPLRGAVRVATRAHDLTILAGSALVPDRAAEIRGTGRSALWATVTGTDRAWRMALGHLIAPNERCAPLAGLQPDARRIARAVVGLLRRRARGSRLPIAGMDEDRFLLTLARNSQDHLLVAERCPGRTLGQRIKVYTRLQTARVLMLAQSNSHVSIERLAALSGYSAAHFMRTFHATFGETVYGFLTRSRLAHARSLLASGEMAVAEVAIASGFEDRGTFSRQFRRHFGVTAVAWRRRHACPSPPGTATRQRERHRAAFGTSPDRRWNGGLSMYA